MLGVSAAAAADAAPGAVLAGVSESHMSKLLRDDLYSRLLEVSGFAGCLMRRRGCVLRVVDR